MKARICLLAVFLVAPASWLYAKASHDVVYHVTSDPPGASIDANDTTVCEATPCDVTLKCVWYVSVAKVGKKYKVKAIPPANAKGQFVQKKEVKPCEIDPGGAAALKFNMTLTPENQ